MYRGRGLIIALVAVMATSLLAVSSLSAGDDASDMAARAKSWQEAFNAGNPEAIAALYTEDGMRLPYQAPPVKGRTAITASIQAARDAGGSKAEIEVVGTESQGNMAWAHGTYVLKNAEGDMIEEGKWMNVSKKVGGEWLIHCDIWNTNAPEAGE